MDVSCSLPMLWFSLHSGQELLPFAPNNCDKQWYVVTFWRTLQKNWYVTKVFWWSCGAPEKLSRSWKQKIHGHHTRSRMCMLGIKSAKFSTWGGDGESAWNNSIATEVCLNITHTLCHFPCMLRTHLDFGVARVDHVGPSFMRLLESLGQIQALSNQRKSGAHLCWSSIPSTSWQRKGRFLDPKTSTSYFALLLWPNLSWGVDVLW